MQVSDCEALRRELKPLAERLRKLVENETNGEAIANVMLAYRHLEEANFLLQFAQDPFFDGGVSVYDKAQVPDAH